MGNVGKVLIRASIWDLVSACLAAKPEADELITKLLAKYAEDGQQELGQAQFAALLQTVLQDLAESLEKQPIIIVRDVKVLNGSHLRKVWDFLNVQLLLVFDQFSGYQFLLALDSSRGISGRS